MRDRPEDQFTAEFNVSRETLERLAEYANLIAKWTPKINLVSRQSLQDLWRRHFNGWIWGAAGVSRAW